MITSMNAKHFAKLVNDLVMYEDGGRQEIEGTTTVNEDNQEEFAVDQDSLDGILTSLLFDEAD